MQSSIASSLGDAEALIELSISCHKLANLDLVSKSDPFVVVLLQNPSTGTYQEIGRTETIDDNLNPSFVKTIKIDYMFEVVQNLLFRVYDYDSPQKSELIGECTCKLTDVILSHNRSVTETLKLGSKPGKSRGQLTVVADDVEGSNTALSLTFAATKVERMDMFGKSDPFLVLSRVRDSGVVTASAKTEVIKNTLNPQWSTLKTSVRDLCGGNLDAIVRIECFDWNKRSPPDFIGACQTSCAELMKGNCSWPLINPKKQKKSKKYKHSGLLRLTNVVAVEEASFFDFIAAGLEIQVIAAIDYTLSNGKPEFSNSLHHINPYAPNEYQTALLSVASVLAPYDHDGMIPVYGFGGKPNGGHTNHCFPLTGNPAQPAVHGVDGLMAAYLQSIQSIKLSGPTVLQPVIQAGVAEARQAQSQKDTLTYTVLLILTDGVYNDRQKVIDEIVAASNLPLSIIIVGVGQADFSAMEELDADDVPLRSTNGTQMTRDIVQFVPFREFKGQAQAALAKSVLEELPEQVVDYYHRKGIKKPPPRKATAPHAAPVATHSTTMSSIPATAPPSYDDIVLDDESSEELPLPAASAPPAVSYPDLHM